MKRVIIVQARISSTRLAGKVLADLAGRPLLAQQLRRLQQCRQADAIVVATSDQPTDEAVVQVARQVGVGWFCGDEHDVLRRFVAAARDQRADVVVRVTGDCPLIDPEVTDRVIQELTNNAGAATTRVTSSSELFRAGSIPRSCSSTPWPGSIV